MQNYATTFSKYVETHATGLTVAVVAGKSFFYTILTSLYVSRLSYV